MGRLLVHEEVPATNIGLEKHILQNLKPRLLSNRYIQFKVAVVGDPAGIAKNSHSEETSLNSLNDLASQLSRSIPMKSMPTTSCGGFAWTSDKWWTDTRYQRPRVPYAMSRYVRRLPLCKGKARRTQAEAGKLDEEGYSHVRTPHPV